MLPNNLFDVRENVDHVPGSSGGLLYLRSYIDNKG